MSAPIFDQSLHRLRRQRSARTGGDRFLQERAFGECLDRLADIRTPIAAALIVGEPGDGWIAALSDVLPGATVKAANAEDLPRLEPGAFDLCLSIGELETSNDLTIAAFTLRHLLSPGGLLLGAIVGGNSLPRLRAAMLAADRLRGAAAPRIHPTVDGPSLAALLTAVGLTEPVIDIDRIDVAYASLDRLVNGLRAMGCTNILSDRSRRPLDRRQRAVARDAFLGGADHATEQFELLHFTAWAPQS